MSEEFFGLTREELQKLKEETFGAFKNCAYQANHGYSQNKATYPEGAAQLGQTLILLDDHCRTHGIKLK